MRWVEPVRQLFRSKAAMGMGMGMGGAITAVAATIMVGTAATTTVGGIIAIGGDFHVKPKKPKAASVGGLVISRMSAIGPKTDMPGHPGTSAFGE
jgi:hypothetical protein